MGRGQPLWRGGVRNNKIFCLRALSSRERARRRRGEVEQFMKEKGIVRNQRVSVKKVERSRELRKTMTDAESEFWEMVRGRKLYVFKFRRQQVNVLYRILN